MLEIMKNGNVIDDVGNTRDENEGRNILISTSSSGKFGASVSTSSAGKFGAFVFSSSGGKFGATPKYDTQCENGSDAHEPRVVGSLRDEEAGPMAGKRLGN